MTLEPSRIAKNTIYLTVATVGQKFLAFFYFALIARMIGVENTGKYFFVVSFTIIFSIFIDLGLSSVLTREIAKNKEKAGEYLGNILTAKIFFFILTYFAVALTVNFLGYSAETKNMVYLAGLVMFFDSFHLTFYAVFRGLHNLKYEAMGVMVGQLVTITFGGLSLFWGAPLYFLIIALILGSAAVFVYSGLLLRIKTEIRPRLTLNRKILQFLFKIKTKLPTFLLFSRLPLGLFLETPPNFSDRPKQLLSNHAAPWAVFDILGSVPREIASEFLK